MKVGAASALAPWMINKAYQTINHHGLSKDILKQTTLGLGFGTAVVELVGDMYDTIMHSS